MGGFPADYAAQIGGSAAQVSACHTAEKNSNKTTPALTYSVTWWLRVDPVGPDTPVSDPLTFTSIDTSNAVCNNKTDTRGISSCLDTALQQPQHAQST
jgi:hypothetical protein